MCYVASSDIFCFVVDCVESFMGLQAEGGDREKDKEQRGQGHILQEEKQR